MTVLSRQIITEWLEKADLFEIENDPDIPLIEHLSRHSQEGEQGLVFKWNQNGEPFQSESLIVTELIPMEMVIPWENLDKAAIVGNTLHVEDIDGENVEIKVYMKKPLKPDSVI